MRLQHSLFRKLAQSCRSVAARGLFACCGAALLFVPSAVHAQVFQSGDIIVPANVPTDPYGGVHGVMDMVRGSTVTHLFESETFWSPTDMIVDKQGRLVFIAHPRTGNDGDQALFRLDPATGALERLFLMRRYVSIGDTLPEGIQNVVGYSESQQSLHLEKSFSMSIADNQNNGWPEFLASTSYAWSMNILDGTYYHPHVLRYHTETGIVDEGTSLGLLRSDAPVDMTGSGMDLWYEGFGRLGHAKTDLGLDGHWTIGHTTIDAHLRVTPVNEILYDNVALDNTLVPNISVKCGDITDDNVPAEDGSFHPFTANCIGQLDGALYASTNEGGSGVPYMFSIQGRPPFLNPYDCNFYNAVTCVGPIPWTTTDGVPTASYWNSADGGGVLADNGNLLRLGNDGSTQVIVPFPAGFNGRPVRWTGSAAPASAALAAATTTAVVDTPVAALVLRADTLVNVLITDPSGKKIGFNADGSTLNDFGVRGVVSAVGASGWPHLIALVNPTPGTYTTQIAGLGAGTYGVTGYLGQSDVGGNSALATGDATSGSLETRTLQIVAPLSLTWSGGVLGVGGGGSTSLTFGFDHVGPVPSRGEVRFACRIPVSGSVSLEIFDPAGRRVREVTRGERGAGRFEAVWRGETENGGSAAPGIYLARLAMPGHYAVRRIALIR
jgi:hypothetical protein